MAKHHGAKHFLFRKFLGFRFNHQHGVLRAGDHEVEIRVFICSMVGFSTILAVDARRRARRRPGP